MVQKINFIHTQYKAACSQDTGEGQSQDRDSTASPQLLFQQQSNAQLWNCKSSNEFCVFYTA